VAPARAAFEKNSSANKPLVNVESDCFGFGLVKPYTADDVRAEGWWFMLSGGADCIYLNGEYYRGQETGGSDTHDRIVPERKILRDFMESLDLAGLARFTGVGGVPTDAFASAIAEPGRQYALDLFHGKNDDQWGAHFERHAATTRARSPSPPCPPESTAWNGWNQQLARSIVLNLPGLELTVVRLRDSSLNASSDRPSSLGQ
jgi:hypothetical protein